MRINKEPLSADEVFATLPAAARDTTIALPTVVPTVVSLTISKLPRAPSPVLSFWI